VNATISNFTYKKGSIDYRGRLKKGECTVLSIRAVFKSPSLPQRINVSSLSVDELLLPDATLRGGNGNYTLGVWIPKGYDNWSLSVLVPRKLGRNSSYAVELDDYLNALVSHLQKRIVPLDSLKRPTIPEPEPPNSYCAELSAPGDLIYTQRPLDFSALYSDGSYYESDFSGNSSREITLRLSARGCTPAVWVMFRGKSKSFLNGPFLSSVLIEAKGRGGVWSSEIEVVDDVVVQP